jgi:hypothetical protein
LVRYDYRIKYYLGIANSQVDMLSRRPDYIIEVKEAVLAILKINDDNDLVYNH